MTPREETLCLKLAIACKSAGLLDAELPLPDMILQAHILVEAARAAGLYVALQEDIDGR